MRDIGPAHKKPTRDEMAASRRMPKPDFVSHALSARELHAYYVALISARTMTFDHGLLKVS